MQIRQLEYFLAVATDGSFTAASERLHVVQSGVSAAIRTLERELGAPLFERTARGVVLSDEGTTLVPYAHAVLAQVREAADAVHEVRRGVRGTVVVGVLPVLGLVDLPPIIADYHQSNPHVAVRLVIGGTRTLAESLNGGAIDFALIAPAGPIPADLSLTRVGSAPFVALVPAGHRLAGRAEVSLVELADFPFIDSPVGFGNRDLLDQEMAQRGLRRDVIIEVPDASAIRTLVGKRAGVALVPRFVAEGETHDVDIIQTSEALEWSLSLATADHHPPSHAARLLVQAIMQAQRTGGAHTKA